MQKIFYEKRGRRYHPVSEYDSDLCSSMSNGTYVVNVKPGVKSTVRLPEVEGASEFIELLYASREEILDALVESLSPTVPEGRQLTEEQQEALKSFQRAFGDTILYRRSAVSVFDSLVLKIRELSRRYKDES